jgi:hypothetical protein
VLRPCTVAQLVTCTSPGGSMFNTISEVMYYTQDLFIYLPYVYAVPYRLNDL